MVITVGINGFGRIGRIVFRTCLDNDALQVSAINDPSISVEYICYLIKFDSTHGKFWGSVTHSKDHVIVNGRPIRVFQEKSPSSIPWNQYSVKYVIEASGLFTSLEKASGHLESESVFLVLVTSPSTDIPMLVIGVNEATQLTSSDKKVLSCASSTLYCLALIMKLLDDNYGVEQGFVTSIHAMSSSLKPVDGLCTRGKNWRDHRSIHQNIIPGSTGACRALVKIMPQFKDKLKALTFRVPIVNVSLLDLSIRLVKNTSLTNIVNYVDRAGKTTMKNLIRSSKEDAVSSDFIGDRCSCILDVNSSLQLKQNFFKLVCWYENEYSYSCRIIEAIMMSENYLQHRLLSSMSFLQLTDLNASNTHSRIDASNSSSEILQNILMADSKSITTFFSKVSALEIPSKNATSLKLDKKCLKGFKIKTKDSMKTIIDRMISDCQVKIRKEQNIHDRTTGEKPHLPVLKSQGINEDHNLEEFVRPDAISNTFLQINNIKSPCSWELKDNTKKYITKDNATVNKNISQRCSSDSATLQLQHNSLVRLSVGNSTVSEADYGSRDTKELRRPEVTNNTSKLKRNTSGHTDDIKKNPCLLSLMITNKKSKCSLNNNFNNELTRKAEDCFENEGQSNNDELKTKKALLNTISSDMYMYFVDDKTQDDNKDMGSKFDDKNVDDVDMIDYMPKECLIFRNNLVESQNYLQEILYTSDVGSVREKTMNINKFIKDSLCEKLDSVSITDSENSLLINGRKSQVLAISDVTVSIEDLKNLEQICQIIEVSDELSDKLLSKLTNESNGDKNTTKCPLKDFCKTINLNDFCQELLGNFDNNE